MCRRDDATRRGAHTGVADRQPQLVLELAGLASTTTMPLDLRQQRQQRVDRERPQRDRAEQTGLHARARSAADGALGHLRRGVAGDDQESASSHS
jgi:hypothetical protein